MKLKSYAFNLWASGFVAAGALNGFIQENYVLALGFVVLSYVNFLIWTTRKKS